MVGAESLSSQWAAWVEAIGAIAAVIGTGWVAASGSRAALRREEHAEALAANKDARIALATSTAALNLAILAATQITDLHVALKDEAWRGRVARVSASRSLLTTQHMLTAFPIQSLGSAPAMVEFSRFPAALAVASEIYSNLETAVRAADIGDRAVLFDACNKQMERLDAATAHDLVALRTVLRLEPAPPIPVQNRTDNATEPKLK